MDVSIAPAGKPFVLTASGVATRNRVPFVDRILAGSLGDGAVAASFDNVSLQELGVANFQSFGSGLGGATGIPTVQPSAAADGLKLAVSNTAGKDTACWILLGERAAASPFLGGTLYVSAVLVVPLALPAAGATLTIPGFDPLQPYGTILYLQVWQLDDQAPGGASATQGWELHWGG
jgi:hypothetical protein